MDGMVTAEQAVLSAVLSGNLEEARRRNTHLGAAIELLSLADDLGGGNLAAGVKNILDGHAASNSAKPTEP